MASGQTEFVVILLLAVVFLAAGVFIGVRISSLRAEAKFVSILQQKEAEWGQSAEAERRQALAKSRQVIGGSFSEQLAPYLPDFPFDPTEARFIGKPVDFVVFRGLAAGAVEELVFVEVKSGKSRLNRNESSIRHAVAAGRVSFFEYRVPAGITSEPGD
ncbi:MAG TPA: Holliday junction resolvase-like protein [Turneriella sp.]|nr:Holliday junction resolvase-like protein [Turneriella sp.]HNL09462.1 Holliday junction resolvase-like protein [Turneriella sp.]HNL54010.1 Holliday junction resolvase-like protein [Turneriella sp.]